VALLADFYLSTDSEALEYDSSQSVSDLDRERFSSITPLEISTLGAILQGVEWDVDMMDAFECLLVRDGGERLIHRLPAGLVSELASADEQTLNDAAEKWARTDELECDPSDVQPILDGLFRLSRRSHETNRNVCLWNCV
jgi:hypothetical protein